jgi:hypothetical protein
MQLPDSQLMFELAHTGYTEYDRGALVAVLPSLQAFESEEKVAYVYRCRTDLLKMDYAEVLKFVDTYDSSLQYVTLAAVTVRLPKAGKDNAIKLLRVCKVIHKDMCTISPPNYGHRSVELRSYM